MGLCASVEAKAGRKFILSCERGDFEEMKHHLDAGADPNLTDPATGTLSHGTKGGGRREEEGVGRERKEGRKEGRRDFRRDG